jgi:three-Cys-motif partner protein
MTFHLSNDSDPFPNLPIELGRKGEGVGDWVPNQKHTFLAKYIEGTRLARRKFTNRVFVDLFCGPGRIQVKDEAFTRHNGAVIAWRHSQLGDAAFTNCFVGDIDAERVAACEARLTKFGAPVSAFVGPAEQTVDKIISKIPSSSLALAYLDPYNLEFLSFDIIRKLSRLPRIDFAVHFSTMDLRRNLEFEYTSARARFDGTAPGWRSAIDLRKVSKSLAEDLFFDYWCAKVGELGFSISQRMPLVRGEGNKPLYHLVFFSRHPFPNKIWDDVAQGKNRELNFG